uniref:Retrovirus-related Pol polyprotein from transposon TNT 1-94 n=1 Tax=Tanacetum cinerariifolium TaxID=118510 RepID=A0A6L2MX11_TANCI|nr:hypothetical protein [Tanacetum cinerariifolium]
MAAVELPQTLKYRGGQLNAASVLEVENFTNWKKRFMCHILGIEPQFENIIKNGPFIPMTTGHSKPEGQWYGYKRKAANLDRRLKSLIMSVLLDDQMNSVINYLPAKSTSDDLILYHDGLSDVKESRVMDLKLCYNTFKFKEEVAKFLPKSQNTNHVKDSELASLFGKLKYKENLIHSIYETEKNKSFVSATPLSTTFISTYIVQDFQNSPDDEEDTRSSHNSTQHKPELRHTKDFEAKYNKVKAKVALLSSSASASKAATIKNKGLITESYEWDEEVSSDDNEMVEIKCISEQIPSQKKRILRFDQLTEDPSSYGQKDIVFVKSSADDTKVILPSESQRNTTGPLVAVVDSSATEYGSADESSVYSTPLPPLKKLDGAEPIYGLKTIKSILKSKSTFKAKILKGVIINELSSALAKGNKSSSALKVNSAPTGGKTGGLDQISNKDPTILYCLANAGKVDYAKLIWDDVIYKLNKKTKEKVVPYPSPSHLSPPTPVVGEMHKEAQQAAGGTTSLGATSEEGAHPQLISGYDEPIIIADESEEEVNKDKDTHATSHDDELKQQKAKAEAEITLLKSRPSYPDINQLTHLLVSSLKPKFLKLLASHDFASCLPTELKGLPSKFTELSREIKELKKHVTDMEIELHGDLKEIPIKLKYFTSTIFSLTFQVADLKNIQWELPAEFLDLPSQVSLVQEKLKTLDSLPSLLNKVIDTLNRFATVVENASGAACNNVPSVGKATALPTEREKNTNPDTTDAEPNLHDELVDILGIYVMTQYYNKKLFHDKYYDKMLKRRKCFQITNSNVLTQKDPISLTVHRED